MVNRTAFLSRVLRHLVSGEWLVHRRFSPSDLNRITGAITQAEESHCGDIRFCVEAALDLSDLWNGLSSQDRATEVFSQLRVWDTERNNGVLLYLLLADRQFEIVADREVAKKVDPVQWRQICEEVEHSFKNQKFVDGVVLAISRISALLAQHFPRHADSRSELPDEPVIL